MLIKHVTKFNMPCFLEFVLFRSIPLIFIFSEIPTYTKLIPTFLNFKINSYIKNPKMEVEKVLL